MLARIDSVGPGLWLALVLFVVIRPLSTLMQIYSARRL